MQRIPCLLGIHKWLVSDAPGQNGYKRIRKVCCNCPSRKYGWKRFGAEHKAFGFTDDRTSWSANPAILDPKRKKVTR